MQPDVGKIYEGKVTGITKFGAFVDIGDGVTGMVHISEVANTFVNEIKDHLTEGQQVKVKVLAVSEEGKVSLSIKKALPPPAKPPQKRDYKGAKPDGSRQQGGGGERRPRQERFVPKSAQTPESAFEDMLNKFKASSDERMGDIRKNIDSKRRNTSRRKG